MLKIPKGLKKKKKGKKSKKKGEDELFTEEELEQYRREHQAQAQAHPEEQEVAEEDPNQPGKPKNNDEWSKFNALTTGIDSILKKTQGDLDRIKSTSFFQRVDTGPKYVDQSGKEKPIRRDIQKGGKGWVDFEKEKQQEKERQEEHPEQPIVVTEPAEPVSEAVFSESESDASDFDDIFDTSYVEAVEKGEVKLAYVPDSPDEVVDEGPDPFDTSYAEKVIKGPEVSKKGKKLVNIGTAVEVLTGRLDTAVTTSSIKRPKRRVPRDLLRDDVDPDDNLDLPAEDNVSKSLLDDDTEVIETAPVDLSVSLHTQFIKKEENTAETTEDNKDILNTFDALVVDDEDDEFAQLATESLSKPTVDSQPIPQLPIEPVLEETSWAAFEDPKQKPKRPPPPKSPVVNSTQDSPSDFDDGPDPFDTTFAENILPGKAELKQIENEILNDNTSTLKNSDSDFDFDPREDEKVYINNRRKSSVHIHVTDPTGIRESISGFEDNIELGLKPIRRDLLGGSTTDLTQLADAPIAPSVLDSDNFDYSDPFDTSIVDSITAPGKTELKFIEKELLEESESEIKRSLSDPDFDPRAEEKAEAYQSAPRKPSRPENLFVNKAVLFNLPVENLSEADKKKKPVTPYYNREASVADEDIDTQEDLFDTAPIVIQDSNTKPIASILKKSSEESELKRSHSNQDLNSEEDVVNEKAFAQLRRHSDFPINFSKTADFAALKSKTDFLSISEEEPLDVKVLTPHQESKDSIDLDDIDPFDTSIVNNVLLPGKTELKFLESELLPNQSTSNHLLDPDFDPRAEENTDQQPKDLLAPTVDGFQVKALTPEIPETVTGFLIGTKDEEDEIDPFDTSIADNIKPGKTELKLLESEFIN